MTSDNRIPLSIPHLAGDEWSAVRACLDDNWLSSAGPDITAFENRFAETVGAAHAVATINGTAALHLAMIAAGVEKNDEVIVPAITFIATANAVRYLGAIPVVADVRAEDALIDLEALEVFLTEQCSITDGGRTVNNKTGRAVRAIVPVDVLGHPVDMAAVARLAERHHLAIVEDAAEALGSFAGETPVGGRGNLSCFSFNGNKIITTGAGGMVVTDDPAAAQYVRYLSTQAKDDPLESLHGVVGFNYRMPNILAALGLAQLGHLSEFVDRKRGITARYREAFAGLPGLSDLMEPQGTRGNCWLYTIKLDPAETRIGSRELLAALAEAGIETRPLWVPVHMNPPFADCPTIGGAIAKQLADECLCIPSSVGMTDVEQDRVIAAVQDALQQARQ